MVDERKIWAKVIGVVTFVLLEIAALSMLKHAGSLQDIWVTKASHRVMAWAWGGFDNIGHGPYSACIPGMSGPTLMLGLPPRTAMVLRPAE